MFIAQLVKNSMPVIVQVNNIRRPSTESAVELHVCGICFESYNEGRRVPKILVCGHTYCQKCVRSLRQHSGPFTTCPVCRKQTRSRLQDIPTNFQLLQVLAKQNLLMAVSDEADGEGNDEDDELLNTDNNNDNPEAGRLGSRAEELVLEIEREATRLEAEVRAVGLDPSKCFRTTWDEFTYGPGMLASLDNNCLMIRDAFEEADDTLRTVRSQKTELLRMVASGEVIVERGRPKRADGRQLVINAEQSGGRAANRNIGLDLMNHFYNDGLDTLTDEESPSSSIYRHMVEDSDDNLGTQTAQALHQLSVVRSLERMMRDDYDDNDSDDLEHDIVVHHGYSAMCTICDCRVPNRPRDIDVHRNGARHRSNLARHGNQGGSESTFSPPRAPLRAVSVNNREPSPGRGRGQRGRGANGSRGRARRGGGVSRGGSHEYHIPHGGYHMPDPEHQPWADHYDEHGDLFRGREYFGGGGRNNRNDGGWDNNEGGGRRHRAHSRPPRYI